MSFELVFIFFLTGSIEELSFVDVFQKSLERNTDLKAAHENLKALQSKNLPIKLRYLPRIDVSAYQQWEEQDPDDIASSQLGQISAELNLFRFGADKAAMDSALAEEKVMELQIREQILQLEGQIGENLIEYIRRTDKTKVLQNLVKSRENALRISRARFEKGLLPEQEVSSVQIDLENSRSRLSNAKIQSIQAKAKLIEFLGHLKIKTQWPKENLEKISQLQTQSLKFQNLPSWKMLKASIESTQAKEREVFRKQFPSVDSNFAYGLSRQSQVKDSFWSGQITVSFPLFDRLNNNREASHYNYLATGQNFKLVSIQRAAQRKFESAQKSFIESIETKARRQQTLQISRKLYQDNLKRYQMGRANANDLNVDENRLFDSESLAIDGWADFYLNYFRLCHALGKRAQNCL